MTASQISANGAIVSVNGAIGVDIGGHGIKAVRVDPHGAVLALSLIHI